MQLLPDYLIHYDLSDRWKIMYGACSPEIVRALFDEGKLAGKKQVITMLRNGVKSNETVIVFLREDILRFEAEKQRTQETAPPAIETTPPSKTPPPQKPPTQRNNALRKILLEIVNQYQADKSRFPQYNEVVLKLKALCKDRNHPVIQEIEDKKIYWKNSRGVLKTTSYDQLQNRLTRIRSM